MTGKTLKDLRRYVIDELRDALHLSEKEILEMSPFSLMFEVERNPAFVTVRSFYLRSLLWVLSKQHLEAYLETPQTQQYLTKIARLFLELLHRYPWSDTRLRNLGVEVVQLFESKGITRDFLWSLDFNLTDYSDFLEDYLMWSSSSKEVRKLRHRFEG